MAAQRLFPRTLALLIVLSLALAGGQAMAFGKKKKDSGSSSTKGSCASAAQVTSDVWKYAGPILTQVMEKASPQTATAAQILKAIDKGIRAWNKLAGNSWAKIGPRRLDMNTWHEGNVIGVTERVFNGAMVAFRPVTLEFHKRDGKNRVKVVVCTQERGKAAQQRAVFEVDDKTRNGLVKRISIPDAAGKLIKVVIHGKKVGTTSIKYRLKANMEMK